MEVVNFDHDFIEELHELVSINHCSNIAGQLMVALMTNPPKPGDASHALYVQQRADYVSSLKRRAVNLMALFNQLEGVTCNVTEGAIYGTFHFRSTILPPEEGIDEVIEKTAKFHAEVMNKYR
ncbi:Aste57867_7487 [Aphanomyces stellatus]|uniref:Aste57867_4855 protein n=1 Tax=Aphanomyces stellatus TaxID=120398 RepID=A0A485KID1_9STRA|nr:hypothetical protein As57867_007461 [Aphanomyces stellatus]KAF0712360.1 hypothetical protein As57867_004842 [Aphanomyces stellatus]VFT81948.1 Aste57867_4855 [Aphanomyces stellatus]VFT84397.1 Aste57867_7487 [Aphanomyces stellatus]